MIDAPLTQIWANFFMSRGQILDQHCVGWSVFKKKKRTRSQACLIFQLKIVALSINPGENASQVDKICSLRSFGHANVLSLNRVLCLSLKSDFIDLPKKHKFFSKKAIFVEISIWIVIIIIIRNCCTICVSTQFCLGRIRDMITTYTRFDQLIILTFVKIVENRISHLSNHFLDQYSNWSVR